MAAEKTAFHPCAIVEDEHPVGLLYWWQFNDFRYIEHFAVSQELRGRRIGERALQFFVSQSLLPVLLEVECPEERNPFALRRIAFYERNGFRVVNRPYRQPPYHAGEDWLPMRLMMAGERGCEADIERMCTILQKEVYLVE